MSPLPEVTKDFIHKRWAILLMLKGFVLFNCLFVGGYQFYKAGVDWFTPQPVIIDYMSIETADLIEMQKQINSELKFRSNNK